MATDESKAPWKSVTLLGALLTFVAAILTAMGHEAWATSVGVLAGLLTTGGRTRATKSIAMPKMPRGPRGGGKAPVVGIVFALALTACGWSQETRDTKRADAKAAGVELAACAVGKAASCADETVALTVCFVQNGFHCEAQRKPWARCMEAQALACGLPAAVALGSVLIHGVADVEPENENECARDAADRCADNAGDVDALELCLGDALAPCVGGDL